MMAKRLNNHDVIRAFGALGKRIEGYDAIELLLVGGMAGKLAGYLPEGRNTVDCDAIHCEPAAGLGQLEMWIPEVAKEFGLAPNWLNDRSSMFAHWLPPGWLGRRQHLGDFGLLRVFCVGRVDFIVLKALAARAVDQQDLFSLKASARDVATARELLAKMKAEGITSSAVDLALILLNELETRT